MFAWQVIFAVFVSLVAVGITGEGIRQFCRFLNVANVELEIYAVNPNRNATPPPTNKSANEVHPKDEEKVRTSTSKPRKPIPKDDADHLELSKTSTTLSYEDGNVNDYDDTPDTDPGMKTLRRAKSEMNIHNSSLYMISDPKPMTIKEVDNFLGMWLLLKLSFLIVVLCIEELVLYFLWVYSLQFMGLKGWLIVRLLSLFFFDLFVVILHIVAVSSSPDFEGKWELYLFLSLSLLITGGGILHFSIAFFKFFPRSSNTSTDSR